jgi:hypothetical protein
MESMMIKSKMDDECKLIDEEMEFLVLPLLPLPLLKKELPLKMRRLPLDSKEEMKVFY